MSAPAGARQGAAFEADGARLTAVEIARRDGLEAGAEVGVLPSDGRVL